MTEIDRGLAAAELCELVNLRRELKAMAARLRQFSCITSAIAVERDARSTQRLIDWRARVLGFPPLEPADKQKRRALKLLKQLGESRPAPERPARRRSQHERAIAIAVEHENAHVSLPWVQ